MDVFNHNWNQRMKNEPFVNYTLNSDKRPERIRVRIVRSKTAEERQKNPDAHVFDYKNHKGYVNDPRFMTNLRDARKSQVIWNEDYFNYLHMRSGNVMKPGTYYSMFGTERILPTDIPTTLYDNSRPQSLYNLNYTSIR